MKFLKVLAALFLVTLIAAAGGLAALRVTGGTLAGLFAPPAPDTEALLSALAAPELAEAATPDGQALREAALAVRGYTLTGEPVQEGKTARQSVRVTVLDTQKLGEALNEGLRAGMEERVAAASRAAEIYENGAYRPELLRAAFDEALRACLREPGRYTADSELSLEFGWEKRAWHLANYSALAQALLDGGAAQADEAAQALFTAAAAALPILPLHYAIPESALAGPVPDPGNFGETDDPAVIEELLRRPEARALIGEQTTVWNAGIERFPNSPIRYYLDETLLVLVWQEVEARAVGTFSEIFVADGSQLRRKIAGDAPFDLHFRTCSQFAWDTNAVLAVGGDFYHHGRACGISVYQREICRFEPNTCDVCYITADGDMLFSYRGQFTSEDEVRQFLADNDVLFSLAFGPVLIDNGADMTPTSYAWGEINDTYARSALGVKHGICLSNGVGVIDSDYRGEVCAGLCNVSDKPYTIEPFERVCQMVIAPVLTPDVVEVDELSDTARGEGGFGSSGRK